MDTKYASLERYLKDEQWQEADEETCRLMTTEMGKEKDRIGPEDFLNFPHEPLKAIDGLWVKYSIGKLGFSVQREMYLEVSNIPDGEYHKNAGIKKLFETNGWGWGYGLIVKGLVNYPKGYLPGRIYETWRISAPAYLGEWQWCVDSKCVEAMLSRSDL